MTVDLDKLIYIALRKRRKLMNSEGDLEENGKTVVAGPYRVYAIDSKDENGFGQPPYYKMVFNSCGEFIARSLIPGSREYNLVNKWVGTDELGRSRRMLGHSQFVFNDKETARELVEDSEKLEIIMKYLGLCR